MSGMALSPVLQRSQTVPLVAESGLMSAAGQTTSQRWIYHLALFGDKCQRPLLQLHSLMTPGGIYEFNIPQCILLCGCV